MLAGRMAANTDNGLNKVKEKLITAMNRIGRKRPSFMPIYEGRLSKQELMQFPVGSYIISNVFSSLINSFSRNPSLKGQLFAYAILGFALVEAMGLFALMMAFLFIYG